MKSTQIYLTDAEHAALQRAAKRGGVSMTAVVRELVERYIVENEAPPTDLRPLIGAGGFGPPTDVGANKDQMIEEALLADFRRHQRALRPADS